MEEMGKPMPAREGLMGRLLQLGADVPMCAASRPARVRGIGDQIERLAELAALPVLLVNPRIAVATPVIFKALANKNNSGMEALPDDLGHAGGLIGYLARQRNDLQAPALAAAPEIGHVLVELAASAGCALARMSGSGATCFGIFESGEARDAAALQIAGARPDWWVQAALLDGQDRAAAQNIS
jgi:4-diphosphocytidyl-2-C-methyl-D-erythritol kinase